MLRLVLIVLMVFGFCAPLHAESAPSPSVRHQEFVLNNLTFALYHEVGHLLISEFNLPILGKEEDAADNIATMLLLAQQAESANQALMDSAKGWQSWSKVPTLPRAVQGSTQLEFSALAGGHSPDSIRAGQLGCLMVGTRREIFANIALELGLNGNKSETCAHKLGQILASWLKIKSRFIQSGSSRYPVKIVYETTPEFETITELMRANRLLEGVAHSVLSHYDLPRSVTLRAASCGTHNAYFDPVAAELLICYELGEFYLAMATALSP